MTMFNLLPVSSSVEMAVCTVCEGCKGCDGGCEGCSTTSTGKKIFPPVD